MFVSAIAHVAPRLGRCARAVVPASEGGSGWAGWAAGGCMASTCEDGLGVVLAPRVAAGGRRCPRRRCAGRATVTPAQLRIAAPGQGVQRAGCGTEPEQALELADVKNMVLYERGRKRKDGPLTAQQSPPTKRNPGYITAIRLTRPAHATRPRLPNRTHPTLPPHPVPTAPQPSSLPCLAPNPVCLTCLSQAGFDGDLVSQAGFDGDLVSRILSSGEETLRGYGTSEEVSR